MTEAELYMVYKGVFIPKLYQRLESLKYYEEFTFRPDDILIVTYPKSGTTWMQEIVPVIQSEGDFTPIDTIPNWDRVPWLENAGSRANILKLEQRPSPRIFATHFHYNMMPESYFKVKPRVLYVFRNPKDVFTSSYHFHGMVSYLVNPGTVDEFLQKFIDGKIMFGSWFDHAKGWISAKESDTICYMFYEDMIRDLQGSISKLASFLGKTLSQDIVAKIADRCVFKNMKQNKMSNYSMVPTNFFDQQKSEFLRKGTSGDWVNMMSPAQSDHFDAAYKEKMINTNFKFHWDSFCQVHAQ
ncbi:sulfotransferase 2B1-like [Engraulis encrasicolus]|uniref:sulfotransferase 2B1-like n=1 Tax=Engraulis encrasicolus TaxID=184585 RepID=UPI002FD654B1